MSRVLPTQNDYGLLKAGNIDIFNRPIVHNPDGTISTVRSITITDNNGRAWLLPTVIQQGGKWVVASDQAAIQHFKRTGQHLGYFINEAAADKYAETLHRQQALLYGRMHR